jgi:hypothetical protein
MARLTTCWLVLALAAAPAAAQPKTASLPKTGDVLALTGDAAWPKLNWMYESPSQSDAAGRVVVHWFCSPTPKAAAMACAEDLAHIINMRDSGHVYIVGYLAGSEREAKKLDPIRESEGIGKGTVAYGPGVIKLMKQLGVTEAAVVVDTEGKVRVVTTSGDLNELGARDKVVEDLVAGLRDFTTSYDGPPTAKAGEKFNLKFTVQLASWLTFSQKTPAEFVLTVPKDIKCANTTLRGDQMSIEGHALTATAVCWGPKGVYEAQARMRWDYDSPAGAHGTGQDGATYKFEIK